MEVRFGDEIAFYHDGEFFLDKASGKVRRHRCGNFGRVIGRDSQTNKIKVSDDKFQIFYLTEEDILQVLETTGQGTVYCTIQQAYPEHEPVIIN